MTGSAGNYIFALEQTSVTVTTVNFTSQNPGFNHTSSIRSGLNISRF